MDPTKNSELSLLSNKVGKWGIEKIKEILKTINIQDSVSEVIMKESGLKGDNMASVTSCVTVKFENPQLTDLHLFVKRLPQSQAHSAMVTESKYFEKEAKFFMEYIPEIENYCKKLGQEKLMDIYPKCYYADETLVVLENLISTGFTLLDKEEMQDYEAAVIALTNLAKQHAISYAYIKEIGGSEIFLKRFVDFDFLGFDAERLKAVLLPLVEDPIATNIDILSKSNQIGKEKAIEILKKYQGKAYEKFMEPLKRKFDNDDETIRVLNHGDYWNSNMLFLKDGEKLDRQVIIDFQVLNYSTPAVDIGFYLYTSVKTDVRQAKLEQLLEIYLEMFVETTKDLGYKIQMTFDDLYRDYRETFLHGFLMGLSMCTGIAYSVLGGADPTDVDISEFASVYNKLVEKWIADNPEKNEDMARILISVMEEYQKLILT